MQETKNIIIGTYRITYYNKIVQIKNLISHSDYILYVKPLEIEVDILKSTIKKNSKDQKEVEKKRLLFQLQKKLKQLTGGYYFTDDSPIYKALETGILILPKNQGGKHECKLELIL